MRTRLQDRVHSSSSSESAATRRVRVARDDRYLDRVARPGRADAARLRHALRVPFRRDSAAGRMGDRLAIRPRAACAVESTFDYDGLRIRRELRFRVASREVGEDVPRRRHPLLPSDGSSCRVGRPVRSRLDLTHATVDPDHAHLADRAHAAAGTLASSHISAARAGPCRALQAHCGQRTRAPPIRRPSASSAPASSPPACAVRFRHRA